jgi:hypothetical protein
MLNKPGIKLCSAGKSAECTSVTQTTVVLNLGKCNELSILVVFMHLNMATTCNGLIQFILRYQTAMAHKEQISEGDVCFGSMMRVSIRGSIV